VSARIKVGLLGAGYILDSHAKALQFTPEAALHAVCDVSRGRAQRAADLYGIPQVLTSLAELAASDCDVVHILLPPAMHIDAALQLVEAGKSVFLEKPMGLDSAACAALCTSAESRGVAAAVNHNFLFSRGYEALRNEFRSGALGRIDHIEANWHFALPLLQYGPFDSWMLAAPANILFELGTHLGAFIVDLVGLPKVATAVASNPIRLPAEQVVFRHWSAIAEAQASRVALSISITAGQADRLLRVRGRGGSAQLDFGRDIFWRDQTETDNPIFDSYAVADATARTLRRQASQDRRRRLKSALAKRADANPFEESVYRSIRAFYAGGVTNLDSRHNARLATDVVRLCEQISLSAHTGRPSTQSVAVVLPKPVKAPDVLVVGGTGFIGRRLVRKLSDQGYSVRVMTRNARAAAIELGDLPVELYTGSHGNAANAAEALQGIHAVYHLAKCEGKRWQDYVAGDIGPTRVLAEAALAAGVRRFIYTGTIASYDSAHASSTIDNTTPVDRSIARRGHYARSKAACEALLQQLHRDRGLPLVIARPAIVIGPGSPPAHPGVGRFATETRMDFWGDGENPLPLVLVDDVADALVKALGVAGIEGQTLLLTSPPLLSARDYVQALGECMGTQIVAKPRASWRYYLADLVKELAKNLVRHPNRRWPTLHDWQCQSQKAHYDGAMSEQVLGWKPVSDRETLRQRGIDEAVAWFVR
jgi:predicted dehydrogenase/nucleoside-diphosphate-sugar epimerase